MFLTLLTLALVALLGARIAIPRFTSSAAGGVVTLDGSHRLAGCPSSPNCVSTEASDPAHSTPPIVTGYETADEALDAISALIATEPGTAIVTRDGAYLHATWTSRWMRFVDDLEVLADRPSQLQIRSASRVGYSDLGVNAARVERLREALAPGS